MLLIRRRGAKLEERIVPLLKERGPMTLFEITGALGMGGIMARGKVVLALGQMQMEKRLEVIPAPEGTPQLQKVKHIRYRLPA